MKKLMISVPQMRSVTSLFVAVATVALLSGCASSARIDQMTAARTDFDQVSKSPVNSALKTNVAVSMVTGGSETNAMWRSKVSSDAFQRALEESLRNATLLNPVFATAQYQLTADLLDLSQPFMGANLDVSSSVRYSLLEQHAQRGLCACCSSNAYSQME
ncbi:hypothetical protein [Limnohabitans sp. B9-3]|uniref:hypothetical protein n=1 Tax=Limnohabitans sp. B9-3 TaxID=1100707 RepID=UPI001179A87B|nr:hypothetical protein [Limnohabitans sp. B9-3]